MPSADAHHARDATQHLQLLDADAVDHIQHVHRGNVNAVALQRVDQIVRSRVLTQHQLARVVLVLFADGSVSRF